MTRLFVSSELLARNSARNVLKIQLEPTQSDPTYNSAPCVT